jgi:hypothetical protein
MGLGAKIRVTDSNGVTQFNHATTAVGFACSSDSRVHFGLGQATSVREIEVTWPSRIRQTLRNVPVDRVLAVEEAAGGPAAQRRGAGH